jgi:hypothetical protein
MQWLKLGLLFNPKLISSKGLTAALMPIAEIIDRNSGLIRVYYSPRDKKNRSEVHFFEFNIFNLEILKFSDNALYKHGKIGNFDDSGITLGSIVNHNNKKYLFYTGWNLTVNVPMNNSIGVAFFEKNIFNRFGDGPIMTRTLNEPYSCASPFVLIDQGKFKMWYASMDKWENNNVNPKHFYNIKYAESLNGIEWERKCIVCIDYENEDEYAFGRPFILKENNLYKMWYCYRGHFYKIGYAESIDGINWQRKDNQAGIEVSETGWDSEMLEYPFIFDFNNERYMLYNGNGYGKTGIGIAKLLK